LMAYSQSCRSRSPAAWMRYPCSDVTMLKWKVRFRERF
jgi:hypothetical protein